MAVATAVVVAASSVLAVSPASAQWRHHGGGGWHRGGGALAGFAAGAIIGGALASRPYGFYDYGYDYVPGPAYVESSEGDEYCAQRFRSYDPGSGTYLGYDGMRHPLPVTFR